MNDIITILCAKSRRLNKTISRCPTTGSIVKSKYDRAKYFDVEQRPISDLNALYVLLVELQGEPHKCVMRGVLKNGADSARGVRRTLDGADATLTDAKHYWLLIDVDEWPIPESFAALTPEETVDAYIISALPPGFHAVSYVLQWSNGSGLDDGKTLNAHLWFWMDRAIGDKRCKQWAEWHNASKGWRVVDPMVCLSNELLYTAGPQFDGVADPLPGSRLVLATRKYNLVNLRLPPLDWKKPAKAAAPTSAGATPSTSGGEVGGPRLASLPGAHRVRQGWLPRAHPRLHRQLCAAHRIRLRGGLDQGGNPAGGKFGCGEARPRRSGLRIRRKTQRRDCVRLRQIRRSSRLLLPPLQHYLRRWRR